MKKDTDTAIGHSIPTGSRRGWLLLGALFLCGGLFLLLRATAEAFLRETVYYFSTVVVAGFLCYLYRGQRGTGLRWLPPRGVCLVGGLTVAASVFLLWVHADWGFKAMPRDYIDASTARNLHEYREAFVTSSGVIKAKAFIPTRTFVDSGMWLHPYLVSLVHDLTGYRPAAPVLLNAFLLPFFLCAFFYFIWRLADARAAVMGTLLWSILPLLSQSSTGAGSSLLVLLLLTLICLLAAAYLKQPSREREGALALAAVLLAYADLSAAWFALPTILVICLGWREARRCFFSAGLIAWPLLWLPVVVQALRLPASEAIGGVGPLAWPHLEANGPHALNFFFSFEDSSPNSLLLSVLGVVALTALPFLLRRELKIYLNAGRTEWLAVLFFGPFVLLQLVTLLATGGMQLDAFEHSFHSLTVHWLFVAVIVLTLAYLAPRVPQLYRVFGLLVAVAFLAMTAPNNSKAIYLHKSHKLAEQRWLERISTTSLQQDAFVIDRQTVPWALREWTAERPEYAMEHLGRITGEVARGRYPAIYLVERLIYKGGGKFQTLASAEAQILESVTAEVVAEKSFRPFTLTRVSRLVAYHPVDQE
jgi:hypothetical protein